jgi:hypothetical protein
MFDFNSVKLNDDNTQEMYEDILYNGEIEKLQKHFPYDKFYINNHKIVCDGGLTFDSSIALEKLPDNLQLNYLDIRRNSKLKTLPNFLTVNKLTISSKLITKLPNKLIIKDRLCATYTNITDLPNDLQVYNLEMSSSKLKYIPKNLKYFNNMFLSACNNIKTLPDNLLIFYRLNISYSNIRKLPKNLYVESLSMLHTKIKELPLDLKVTKNIYISKDMKDIKNFDKFKDKIIFV